MPLPKLFLASQHQKSGRTEEALPLYRELNNSPRQFYSYTYLTFLAKHGDKAALEQALTIVKNSNNNVTFMLEIASVYLFLGEYDQSTIWLNKLIKKGTSIAKISILSIFDPAKNIDHVGLNKILNTPDIAKWMKIRHENYELFNNKNNPL